MSRLLTSVPVIIVPNGGMLHLASASVFNLVPRLMMPLVLTVTMVMMCPLCFQVPANQLTPTPDVFSQTPVSLILKSMLSSGKSKSTAVRYHLTPTKMAKAKEWVLTTAGRDVEK